MTIRIRKHLNEKDQLPMKLRTKSLNTLQLISEPLKSIIPLVEYSFDYHHLSNESRQQLKRNNLFFTGAINGYFLARETDAFHNSTYMTACGALYGYDYMIKCAQDNQRLESNGNLIKLMLFVLIFSSNCSIVLYNPYDHHHHHNDQRTTLELVINQDRYVTMLWKYMVYLYGYNEAAKRFSSMIKSVLDMFHRVEELPLNPSQNKVLSRHTREMDSSSMLA